MRKLPASAPGVPALRASLAGIVRPALFAASLLAALVAPPAQAESPAVARPRYQPAGGGERTGGTVFFLETQAGIVAVGAAHNFDRVALGVSPEVRFELGHTRRSVSRATRLLATPGLPFSEPGGTVRDDLALFVLDVPPAGVRTLRAGAPAREGERIVLLGIPSRVPRDEDDLFGRVRAVEAQGLEIELDATADLQGWGGAPIVSREDGRVVGVLQAAARSGTTLRLSASPIEAALEAAARPLDGGAGRPFAKLPAPAASAGGAASGAKSPAPRRTAERAPEPDAPRSAPSRTRAAGREATADRAGPLLGKQGVAKPGELWLQIDHPSAGAVFGQEQGFVAGRALAPLGEYRRLDVVLVLDVSDSTRDPSGADVNGNGVVGERRGGPLGAVFPLGTNDSGDSILAAEVAAARRLVDRLDPRSTRIGIVTFAGEPPPQGIVIGQVSPPTVTEVPLTTEYADARRGLDRILERGPYGMTHMAAGVDQATKELLGMRGSFSQKDPESDKVVLFLTDGMPTLPFGIEYAQANTRAVLRAAERARRARVRVFTFGIGEGALSGPLAIVRLADITGGSFTPVRDPGQIMDVIEQVDFANLEGVRVRNVTTGADASQASLNPDGSWSALVPLKAGRNVIEATARSTDGQVVTQRVEVQHAPGAPDPPLRDVLVTARNRLLEERLVELQRARLEIERDKAEETRKALALEIEKERDRARERAETQRKSLEIEVDDRGGEEPGR